MSEAPDNRRLKTIDSRSLTALVVTAVVAVIAVAALLVAELRETNRTAALREQAETGTVAEAVRTADDDPDNRHVTLVGPEADAEVMAVVTEDWRVFLTGGSLRSLDDTGTYQLWAEAGGVVVPVGYVGPELEPSAFRVPEGTDALKVTREAAPGSTSPSVAVVEARLP